MALALLYGGTFDPVHAGHLAVASAARAALGANVAFLPAADPPHRAAPGASAEQRAHMIELAIAGQPGFAVDRRELHRAGPSWTVDTLREVRGELGPDAPLAWLVGADAFRGLPDWHQWRALFDLAHFVVAVRPGHGLDALPAALADACAGRWLDHPAGLPSALRAAFSASTCRCTRHRRPSCGAGWRPESRTGAGCRPRWPGS